MKKVGKFLLIVLVVALVVSQLYTMYLENVHRLFKLQGTYIVEEDGQEIVVVFNGETMSLYTVADQIVIRADYDIGGIYYNKHVLGGFVDREGKRFVLEGANEAGTFYAECVSMVGFDIAWGTEMVLNEEEIVESEKENGTEYSFGCAFAISADMLHLDTNDATKEYDLRLKRVNVITGDIAYEIELIDSVYNKHFR